MNKSINKVWVTWQGATGKDLLDKVTGLKDDADVSDLRRKFVEQQNLNSTSPATLDVFETKDGKPLRVDQVLKQYFAQVTPGSSVTAPGPGKSSDRALVVEFPRDCKWCVIVFVVVFLFEFFVSF